MGKRVAISDEELLAAIRHFELTEGPTTLREFCLAMELSESTLARRFGGWTQFRETAGLPREVRGARHTGYTRDELVDRLEEIAKHEGPDVSQRQFERMTGISASTILRHCGSWKAFRTRAGLPPRKSPTVTISDLELLDDLDRVSRMLGRFPTWRELRTHGRFGESTYHRRFGKRGDLIRALYGHRIDRELRRRMLLQGP